MTKDHMVYVLILSSVFLSALAHLILKLGVARLSVEIDGDVILLVLAAMKAPLVWLGTLFYMTAFGLWLAVLRQVDVTFAYPFISLGFVLVLVLGWAFLGEAVTTSKLVGTALIVAGILSLVIGRDVG